MSDHPLLSGEDRIIPVILRMGGLCGSFLAMCEESLFRGEPYNPYKARTLLADVLREIRRACDVLGIPFSEVVAMSAGEHCGGGAERTKYANLPVEIKWRAD